ncbi:MAG TPA: DUF3293 domain-containing protein [Bacteroidia bacterium]|nr:DUF3293 domain-containing protein [Bacteroidia bacterium]
MEDTVEAQDGLRPLLRPLGYLLAAGPAFFLPFAYLVTVGWLVVYALPAAYDGQRVPEPEGWIYGVASSGFYALAVQWPVYAVWMVITKRLTFRLKLLWLGVLVIFSLVAIPWFLVAMFRGTEKIELLRFIRRRSVRRFFAAGLGGELPTPQRFHLSLRPEYRQVRFRCDVEDVPPEFRIVTAWNPDGEKASPEENEEADRHLRSELERLGFESFPVTGGNPDFSHAEPGYGIVCNRAEGVLLARRFRQEAFYEVLGGRVYLVSVHEGHAPGDPVGRWRELVDS